MTNQKLSKEFLHGVPELLVLRLLSEREMYGYEIVRSIRLHSNEKISNWDRVVNAIQLILDGGSNEVSSA